MPYYVHCRLLAAQAQAPDSPTAARHCFAAAMPLPLAAHPVCVMAGTSTVTAGTFTLTAV